MHEYKNPNVILYLVSTFLSMVGYSVWGYTLLSNILYMITNDTLKIGYSEGVQGVISGVLAIPFGMVADKLAKTRFGRRLQGRIGVSLRIVVAIALIYIMTEYNLKNHSAAASNTLYWLIFGALALYGVAVGIGTASLTTLFTNSIRTGNRSAWMTTRQVVMSVGLCVGPIIAIIIFKIKGDHWTMLDMVIPWNVSLGFTILANIIFLFMHDKWCLEDTIMGNCDKVVPEARFMCFTIKHVPVICAIVDCVFGFASGMSVKFFPLFFQQAINYTPTELQILFVYGFGFIGVATIMANKVGKKIGRIQTCMLFPYIGLSMLLVIILGKDVYWDIKWLIGIAYVIRTGLMNAPAALHTSVVDDYVDSDKRGFWNSLEFVYGLGWSGSAILGGLLVQKIGYQLTFVATFGMQFFAISLYWFLVPLVSKKEYILTEPDEESLIINDDQF
jgi:Major Facilitator Superfamily